MKSYKLRLEAFDIFSSLKNEKNCFFLDSSLNSNYSLGRYSFLGFDPFYILKANTEGAFRKLRELLDRYKICAFRKGLPFYCGAVGFLAYPGRELDIPDSYFGFYNSSIIIDHLKKLLYICVVGFPEKRNHLSKVLCESNFKKMHKLLSRACPQKERREKVATAGREELKANFSKKEYVAAIKKAKEYIKKGDIYQVNLSQRFEGRTTLSGFEIYRRLRKLSPSYFSAYLDCQDFQILSSSPERFLKLEKGVVTTRPMKGTRPRSNNKLKDSRLKNELLESAKDKAELTMIVDLERNDLGRVCNYDSIKVNTIRELEEYSTVFQTTATVSGSLHKAKDRIDLLRASFPGGSITGCPKIRAMEIIEELEPTKRSIYTGALGYLDFSGNMDFNILIRTILKHKDKVYFGSGGGIVADSIPEAEYEETLVKAAAMHEAIR